MSLIFSIYRSSAHFSNFILIINKSGNLASMQIGREGAGEGE